MTKTIKGSVVLITGASGAIAQALIAGLAARGAAKIYATARDISGLVASDHLVPIKMDVSSDDDVKKAAAMAGDVTLLINNAGINHNTSFMTAPDLAIASREIEANYIGPLRVTRATRADRQSWRRAEPADDPGAGEPAVHGILLRLQGGGAQPDAGIAG